MFFCCITAFVAQMTNHDIMIDKVSILHFSFLERGVELCPKRKTVNGWKLAIFQYYYLNAHVYRKKVCN